MNEHPDDHYDPYEDFEDCAHGVIWVDRFARASELVHSPGTPPEQIAHLVELQQQMDLVVIRETITDPAAPMELKLLISSLANVINGYHIDRFSHAAPDHIWDPEHCPFCQVEHLRTKALNDLYAK